MIMTQPSKESIYNAFNDVSEGKYTNISFSNAEAVIVSKELYFTLQLVYERYMVEHPTELEEYNEETK